MYDVQKINAVLPFLTDYQFTAIAEIFLDIIESSKDLDE